MINSRTDPLIFARILSRHRQRNTNRSQIASVDSHQNLHRNHYHYLYHRYQYAGIPAAFIRNSQQPFKRALKMLTAAIHSSCQGWKQNTVPMKSVSFLQVPSLKLPTVSSYLHFFILVFRFFMRIVISCILHCLGAVKKTEKHFNFFFRTLFCRCRYNNMLKKINFNYRNSIRQLIIPQNTFSDISV